MVGVRPFPFLGFCQIFKGRSVRNLESFSDIFIIPIRLWSTFSNQLIVMKVDGACFTTKKGHLGKNSASRAKDIWEVVAWMGILTWHGVRYPHPTSPPEGVGSFARDGSKGTPRVGRVWLQRIFRFIHFWGDWNGWTSCFCFFFWGKGTQYISCFLLNCLNFEKTWLFGDYLPLENCLLVSLLFGAVIHMGSCLMTGWQAFPDPKWGAETKKPIESTKTTGLFRGSISRCYINLNIILCIYIYIFI